jgi:hypothetical protein
MSSVPGSSDAMSIAQALSCAHAHWNAGQAEQFCQPIYKTSKGRWKAYAGYLGPLLAALGIDAP